MDTEFYGLIRVLREVLLNGQESNDVSYQKVKKFFYNHRNDSKYPFQEFLSHLFTQKLIESMTAETIQFSPSVRNDIENLTKGLSNMSLNVKSKTKCSLCCCKFKTQNQQKTHSTTLGHTLRELYATKKSAFNDCHSLALVYEATQNRITEISVESGQKFTFKALLINTYPYDVEISQVVKINVYSQIKMKLPPYRKLFLSSEAAEIIFTGQYASSGQFTFPIGFVVKNKYDIENMLIEINVKVTSSFSDLLPTEPYIPKKAVGNKKIIERDNIVQGEKIKNQTSLYTEAIPLQPYKIPSYFLKWLEEHADFHPHFTERMTSINSSKLADCSKCLKIPFKMTKNNYSEFFMNLLNIEEFQMHIDIRDYDTTSTLTRVGGNRYELVVPGLAEARPSLIRNDSIHVSQISGQTTYEGIVHQVKEQSVVLGFSSKFTNIFVPNMKFNIQFNFSRRPIKVEKQAVVFTKKHDIVHYVFPEKAEKTIKTTEKIHFYNKKLNEEQKCAIENIMTKSNAPYIIFGPPGTGKTETVVEAIYQIYTLQSDVNILVCAPSNEAVDIIAKRILTIIPTKGHLFRLYGFNSSKNINESLKQISNINEDGSFLPCMNDLLKYRIVFSTLITAARLVNGKVPFNHYNYVFVDESGYATEPETLAGVAGIISDNDNPGKIGGQLVLAGDPRQLGPILHSNFVKLCGLGNSLIERLIDTVSLYARKEDEKAKYDPTYITKLVRNYRSHKRILDVSNKLFYDNDLCATEPVFTQRFNNWEYLNNKNFPVVFHNVSGDDLREKNSPSFFNVQEVEVVHYYLSLLIGTKIQGSKITQDDIAIITPYRKQAEKIRTACLKSKWNVQVGTVENFQGRESLIVIVSTVRSKNVDKFGEIDKKHQIGFLRNAKRFNVCLTRAKALQIVIGNADVLCTDVYWNHFIKHCSDNNSIYGRAFELHEGEVDYLIPDTNNEFAPCDLNESGNEGADFSRGNN